MTDPDASGYGDERPDTDDYDLLTYGEVAVRITEVLKEEQDRLAELERSGATEADTAVLRRRVADLDAGRTRYQQHAATSETFMQRFGLPPRTKN